MNKLFIFSGAGLSADSGVPTFRDKDGLWRKHDLNKVCDFFTWEENYELVHEFYSARRVELATVKPNLAHQVIADLQLKYGTEQVEIWTQNIDDLLERAGALNVKHVHGYLTEMICTACSNVWNVGYHERPQECQECRHPVIKPNVTFFNQPVPAYNELISTFHKARKDQNATILVIGTSGNVVPFNWIIGNYKETKEAFKILCNKDKVDADLSIFDMCFIKSAIDAGPDLRRVLTDRLEGILTR